VSQKLPLKLTWQVLYSQDFAIYISLILISIIPLTYHWVMYDFQAASLDENDPTTIGKLLGIDGMNYYDNRYEFRYSYEIPGRGEYIWESFLSSDAYPSWADKPDVVVRYKAAYPYISKIDGMDHSPNQRSAVPWIFIGVILVALGGLFFRIFFSLHKLDLIANGVVTSATLKQRKRTDNKIREKWVYKLTFEFWDESGQPRIHTYKTHNVKQVLDEKEELIVYAAQHPERAMLIDSLPLEVARFVKRRLK